MVDPDVQEHVTHALETIDTQMDRLIWAAGFLFDGSQNLAIFNLMLETALSDMQHVVHDIKMASQQKSHAPSKPV